jgi:fucose 4-O-acetylase-like acetyltransferase
VDRPGYIREMQIARGIGILLVTVGHSEPIKDVYPHLFNVIYAFHMPLFFFLSGFFSLKSAAVGTVREWRTVVWPRLLRLIIPYFAITLTYSSLKWLLPGLAKRPVVLSDLLVTMLIYPTDNPALFLWFLYTLIIMRAFAPLLMRLNAFALLAVFLFFQVVTPDVRLLGITLVLYYGLYYYLGLKTAAMGRDRFLLLLKRRMLPIGSLCVFAAACVAQGLWPTPLLKFPAAASGILFVLSACSVYGRFLPARFLEYIGRYSLQIYLLQYFFIFPSLFVLLALHVPGRLIVFATFAVGLAGPLSIVSWVFPRSRIISLLYGGAETGTEPQQSLEGGRAA